MPEYVHHMQQELFDCLAGARSLKELCEIKSTASAIYRSYIDNLESADIRDLAIHRRISRLNYPRKCAEAAAVQAYGRQGITLAPGMAVSYVV